MKTEQEIKAKIIELEAEKDYWLLEAEKDKREYADDQTVEYDFRNAGQYAFQITILRWVLDLPLIH